MLNMKTYNLFTYKSSYIFIPLSGNKNQKNYFLTKLIKYKMEKESHDKNCAICFDIITYPLITLNCKHIFHEECLLKWVNYNFSQNLCSSCPSCPICRNPVITYFLQKTEDSNSEEKTLKKVEECPKKIIRTNSKLIHDIQLALYQERNYIVVTKSISIDELIELRMKGFNVIKYDRRYQISW